MNIQRHWLATGAAVVAALGIGFAAARLLDAPPPAAESHADEEAEGPEGFVALPLAEAEKAGVRLAAVERGGANDLILPGRAEIAPGAEAHVDAPLPGAVVRVHVAPGARVRRGSPLATLRSPEGAAAHAEAESAAAAAQAARAALERDRSLFERGYVPRSRLDVTEAEARRADAQLAAARARLAAWGSPGANGLVVVRSPSDGVVTRLIAAPGLVLHEEALDVALVADAGRVELVFDAPPAAARVLAPGARLEVRLADGQAASATVTAVAPPAPGGVVQVRAAPAGAAPPAGTILSARLPGGGEGRLVVPAEAVQSVDGVPSVFVLEAAGFRARPVVTGQSAGGRVEILNGLTGTERIAGAGAFLLKAELAKGEAEHGH